jgi:hypothetical protein
MPSSIAMCTPCIKIVTATLLSISIPLDCASFVISLQDTFVISSAQLSNKIVSPEELAQHWNIGLATAKRTLHDTTQRGAKKIVNHALMQCIKTVA